LLGLLVNDTSLDGTCYTIQFPISLVSLIDGSTIEVNDAEEALQAILTNDLMSPVYPISVVLTEDGSTVTVENDGDLMALINSCD